MAGLAGSGGGGGGGMPMPPNPMQLLQKLLPGMGGGGGGDSGGSPQSLPPPQTGVSSPIPLGSMMQRMPGAVPRPTQPRRGMML